MNKILDYNVTGQNIELSSAAMLVAGTVNEYTARFSFGADWDGYQRVAVFNADGTEREHLLTDDTCTVPWEVLLPGAYLKVGVYGTRDGSRLPTIWTSHRQYIHDGAGPTDEAADPSPVLAEQILQRMGDLDTLKTEDKSSLVAAINEVKETGGGGGTSDHSKLKNRGAADQHPMSAITGLEDALEGKLPASELPAAINTALAQAKASGEFDGKDGSPGADGKDGVGIQSVTQTTTSTEDGGTNIVTVTKTDGTTSTFEVRNGSRGSTGPAGADGKNGQDGSQGPAGADGKTAYQYAQEGGYAGTEQEFAEKLAAEIPSPYTLPIASETTLGGVKPVSRTAEMTQSVGVDDAGALWAKAASGGGEELLYSYTVTEDNVAINSTSFAISPGIEAWKYTDITVRTDFLFGEGAEENAYIYAGGARIFMAEYFRRAEGGKNSASFSIKCVGDSPENSAAFSYILGFFSGYTQNQIDRVYVIQSGTNGRNITDTTGCIKSLGFSSNNGFVLNSGSTVKIYGIRRGDV